MRTHPRHCKPGEQPCTDEHTYNCASCGTEFICDLETHYKQPSGIVLPGKYWPAHSLQCYGSLFGADGYESNPNAVTWNDIGIQAQPGDDPQEPVDFGDYDVRRWLASENLEDQLSQMSDEGLLDPDA